MCWSVRSLRSPATPISPRSQISARGRLPRKIRLQHSRNFTLGSGEGTYSVIRAPSSQPLCLSSESQILSAEFPPQVPASALRDVWTAAGGNPPGLRHLDVQGMRRARFRSSAPAFFCFASWKLGGFEFEHQLLKPRL